MNTGKDSRDCVLAVCTTKSVTSSLSNISMKNPTCRDRVYASIMGARAIDLLDEGARNRVVVYRNGIFTDYDIDEALTMESTMKDTEEYIIEMLESLTR